jgi:anti-sigma factor RsiW
VSSDQEKRVAQYLLGQLPEEEQAELERRYLADDTLFEELLAIEDDLRDAYVRGELSRPDREAFEQRLLTAPSQKQEQEFARTLCRHLGEADGRVGPLAQLVAKWKSLLQAIGAQPRMVLVPALSATILLLMVGGWWLGRRSAQPLQLPPAPTASGRAPDTAAPTAIEQEPEARTMAVVLSRGLVRGNEEGSKPLVIPPEVSQVRLEARVEVDYPRYEAVLQTAESKRIWSGGDLEAQAFPGGKRILLYLSSSLLPPGDYILTVRGLPAAGSPETVAEYPFRIGKR